MQVKYNIKDMNDFANKKNGKCLSKEYKNAHTKLDWECSKGHQFRNTWNVVQQGAWCKQCTNEARKGKWVNQFGDASKFRKNELNNLKALANRKCGKCLSDQYVNSRSKLKWQCKEGHTWEASPSHIKNNRWCPICGIKNVIQTRKGPTALRTLEEMQELAQQRDGKCLSKEYVNMTTKMKWQCKEGHIWWSTPFSLKREKTWCPICSTGVSERICKKYFEKIFGEKFTKKRPRWLISSKGSRMELDGFSDKLKLAFEYNGRQHYEDIGYFRKKGKEYVKKRKIDDKLKHTLCKERKIVLIEVPYTVQFEDMGRYIIKKAKENYIKVPKITEELNYKLWNIYSPEKIKEMKEIAKSKGGKCLSERYINQKEHLKWQCREGHEWNASSSNITSGKWCPVCAIENRKGSKKYSLDYLKKIAKEKGGELLSKEFSSIKDKYAWKCKEGHIFKTTAYSVMYAGTWCPKCAVERIKKCLRKYNIDDMNEFARGKEGYCLSDKFISSSCSLKWKCKEGHVWEQKWSHIKKDVWCPECSGKKKLTLEHAHKLAKKNEGKCISSSYKDHKSPLKWECSKGHIWETSYDCVRQGHWCPVCSRNKKLTIEDMKKIAKEKGGECLSSKYINARTKLKWKCNAGHIWEAVPDSIRRGSWCRKCSSSKKIPL
ncbi:hypothetical protein J4226_02105 [Candidatus Pacearchaeota archaeon]|nr:hypothetical protein [Candidatus Pacearchaeota archaeon]